MNKKPVLQNDKKQKTQSLFEEFSYSFNINHICFSLRNLHAGPYKQKQPLYTSSHDWFLCGVGVGMEKVKYLSLLSSIY